MFERRLKIILLLLTLAVGGLAARAMQIQVIEHAQWVDEASNFLTQRQPIETTRGRIVDRHNVVLAEDDPCIDACVNYAAITEDADARNTWLAQQAQEYLSREYGKSFDKVSRAQRKKLVEDRQAYLSGQLQDMWTMLGQVSGKSSVEIDVIRHAIIDRVEMRRQAVWLQNYRNALAKHSDVAQSQSWMSRWWNNGGEQDSAFDNFAVDVAEQSEAHVIVPDVDSQTYNELAKNAERFPALVLKASRHRVYPMGPAACHLLGRLAIVSAEQVKNDPEGSDPSRKYLPRDLTGQGGIESLCEGVLRGARGEIIQAPGAAKSMTVEAKPGRNVHLTIDVELQQDIAQMYAARRPQHLDLVTNQVDEWRQNQHGAAVVEMVSTGEVLAMVSCPQFDPQSLSTHYKQLLADDLNNPLLNRATMAQYEPGSIAKPMMALGALSDGIITPFTTIECTGYLVIDGVRQAIGKCWTMREWGEMAARHRFPSRDPHPTGFLNVTDAIERSCNVFFETVADRMGMERQHYWYSQFGLGRPTGIGIPEIAGMIPDPAKVPRTMLRQSTWFSGIGQGRVMATPLQMANAAAAVARGGVWMRPHLVGDDLISPIAGRPAFLDAPSRVNLKFPPGDFAAVKAGMVAVTTRIGGTAFWDPQARPTDALDTIVVAAKTGTPQAPIMRIPARDDAGNVILINGKPKRQAVAIGTDGTTDWYLGDGPTKSDLSHAWFIGFAPADNPQVAFAVFVEYGTRGGVNAGAIGRDILLACIKRGYLTANGNMHVRLEQVADGGSRLQSMSASDPPRPDSLILPDDPEPGAQFLPADNEDATDDAEHMSANALNANNVGEELIHSTGAAVNSAVGDDLYPTSSGANGAAPRGN